MDRVKKTAAATKKFVEDHKVAISVTLTALVCFKLNQMAIGGHNEFLKERGLYDEFYTPTDEEMGI